MPARKARPADKTPAGSHGAEHKADGLAGSAGQAAPAKAAGYSRSEPATPGAPETSHLPLKIFFLLVSLSLLISTLTGNYMAYKYSRGGLVLTRLPVTGIVVPLLLLPF